jgi:hypothetical protein
MILPSRRQARVVVPRFMPGVTSGSNASAKGSSLTAALVARPLGKASITALAVRSQRRLPSCLTPDGR